MDPPDPDQVCKTCQAIMSKLLTTDLPWEDQPGIPHQPSILALEESSQSCSLCFQLWFSVGLTLANRGGALSFMPKKRIGDRDVTIQAASSNFIMGSSWRAMDNGAMVSNVPKTFEPDLSELEWVHPGSLVEDQSQYGSYLFGNWYQSPSKEQDGHWKLIGLGVRLGTSPAIGDALGNKADKWFLAGSYLRVRTQYDSSVAHFIPGRIRNWDLASEKAMGQVKAWLDTCDQHHQCLEAGHDNALLPTRVLHIEENSDRVHLMETQGQRARYVALSHSWGKSHRLTLTKANIASLKSGINVEDIPQTFKDAIIICRALKVEHLWIDSLCIIQDDSADWEHEASKMSSLYTNSYLTISALHSADDSEGCFPTLARALKPKLCTFVSPDVTCTGRPAIANAVPFVIPKESIGSTIDCYNHAVVFSIHGGLGDKEYYITNEWMPPSIESHPKRYGTFNFGTSFDPLKSEPLSSRGWVLQERLLSARTLHYSESQMYWECQNIVLGEDGSMMMRLFPQLQTVVESHQKAMNPQSESILDEWLKIVEVFSMRKLTMEYDKLVAISGLASIIAQKSGDTYYAGLWKSNFLNGLCWKKKICVPFHHCSDEAHEHALPDATVATITAPAQYRAPSWSWAAVDGEIEFKNKHFSSKDVEGNKLIATLRDVRVTLLDHCSFGRVKSGFVKLQTIIGYLHLADDLVQKEAGQLLDSFHITATLTLSSASTMRDGKEEKKSKRLSKLLSGLSVSKASSSSSMSIPTKVSFDIKPQSSCVAAFITNRLALVLVLSASETCYTRIGIAEFGEKDTERFIKNSHHCELVIV